MPALNVPIFSLQPLTPEEEYVEQSMGEPGDTSASFVDADKTKPII